MRAIWSGSVSSGLPYEDIVRGFEYADDEYVVLTDEDFKKADGRRTRTIDIDAFWREIIEQKARGERVVERGEELQPTCVADLVAMLQASLERAGAQHP